MAITSPQRNDQTLPTLTANRHTPFTAELPDLEFAARTDVGKQREHNEDQYIIAHLGRWVGIEATTVGAPRELTSPQGTLLIVADGMGGHGDGEVASAVTLDSFVEHSLLEMPWLGSGTTAGDALLSADVERFAIDCQARLVDVAARKHLARNLGTTLTVAYLTGSRLILVHIGDSRAYLQRGRILTRLTHDHTLAETLGPTADGAPSPFAHVLVNAIGGDRERPKPELSATTLARGDRVLLCTDGLYGPVDDARIAELLASAATAQAAVDALVAEALAKGAPDNVTAVVAFG